MEDKFVCNECGNIYGPFGACSKCCSKNVSKLKEGENEHQLKLFENSKKTSEYSIDASQNCF